MVKKATPFSSYSLFLFFSLFLFCSEISAQDTFEGNVFLDHNGDAIKAGEDYNLPVIKIKAFDDTNNNGVFDAGDALIKSQLTNVDGNYSLPLYASGATISNSLLVQSGTDDVEEKADSSIYVYSSDLEMSHEGGTNEQIIGIRFDGIGIPPGATITNAYLRFQAKANNAGGCSLAIRVEDEIDSETFLEVDENVSNRTTSTDSVKWSPSSWITGDYYVTPSLVGLISDLNTKPGWTVESPVTFIINGTGEREAWSKDGSGTAPELVIEYDNIYLGGKYFIVLEDTELVGGSTITLPGSEYYTFDKSLGTTTNVDFAIQGLSPLCYGMSDNGESSRLSAMNRITGENALVGLSGAYSVEASCFDALNDTYYAADANKLGTVDLSTGIFTQVADTFGVGNSVVLGGSIIFNDIDGLALDPYTGILWGTQRVASGWDALIQIDKSNGELIQDGFGTGEDYVLIKDASSSLPDDIDDIGINPENGKMYGIANNYTGAFDILIEINKATGLSTIIDTIKDGTDTNLTDIEGLGFSNYGDLNIVTGNVSNISNTQWSVDLNTGVATFVGTYQIGTDYESCDCMTAGLNTVSGTVYNDLDGNGTQGGGENGLQNVTVYVYLDMENNGSIDESDLLVDSVETNVSGLWTYNTPANVDFLFEIDEADLPFGEVMTTANLEAAFFENSIGGQSDLLNDFGYNSTGPLPVELEYFIGGEDNCNIWLKWKSLAEKDFNFFEVQRSLDGEVFEFVKIYEGEGNNSHYSFKENGLAHSLYYRLKMIDQDGSYEYSEVVNIKLNCGDEGVKMKLYPNPVLSTYGSVNIIPFDTGQQTSVKIYDIKGQLMFEYFVEKGVLSFDISGLIPGMYLVKGENGFKKYTKRLVIVE